MNILSTSTSIHCDYENDTIKRCTHREQGDSPFAKQIKQATLSNFRRMGPCILFYRIHPVSIQIADSPKKT